MELEDFYYDYVYKHYTLTLTLTYLAAMLFFYLCYIKMFRNSRPRERVLRLKLTRWVKTLSIMLLMVSCVPIIAFGKFENEFIRLAFIIGTVVFTYFANEHFLIRLISLIFNAVVLLLLEYPYYRELVMQLACYSKDRCSGGSSFG